MNKIGKMKDKHKWGLGILAIFVLVFAADGLGIVDIPFISFTTTPTGDGGTGDTGDGTQIQIGQTTVGVRLQSQYNDTGAEYIAPSTGYYQIDGGALLSVTWLTTGSYANVTEYPNHNVRFIAESQSETYPYFEITKVTGTSDVYYTSKIPEFTYLQGRAYDELHTTALNITSYAADSGTYTNSTTWQRLTHKTSSPSGMVMDVASPKSATADVDDSFALQIKVNDSVGADKVFGADMGLYICVDYDASKWQVPQLDIDGVGVSWKLPSEVFTGIDTTKIASDGFDKCSKLPIQQIGRTKLWFDMNHKALSGVTPGASNITYAIVMTGKVKSVGGDSFIVGITKNDGALSYIHPMQTFGRYYTT